MVTRERHRDRGKQLARRQLSELGRELRQARIGASLRQVDVARAAGVSPSWISSIERGSPREVGYVLLTIVFAVVGLDMRTRAYPGPSPVRDEGHRQLLERFRAILPVGASMRTEVPLPMPGDQRAWDAMVDLWGLRVGVEAEMRPRDLQALERRLALKRRDGGIDRLILVLADSRPTRMLMRHLGEALRPSFPLQGRSAIEAIRADRDPACDLLILL